MSTLLETVEHAELSFDDEGNQVFTHIVDCPDDKKNTVAWLAEATVNGLPVQALCGKTWVPTRDPKRFPLCQPCLDIANIRVFEGG